MGVKSGKRVEDWKEKGRRNEKKKRVFKVKGEERDAGMGTEGGE